MDIEKRQQKLKNFFENREQVLLVFIFDSFTEGRLTKESDIDIPILFEKKLEFFVLTD
ncbi:MAG: nucleotidyltransferase domain-containing protein [Thermodesulfovibrio sp.]|uniref:nucleotidyltransferase domain-containing protein n=1 Tax=unclassified Thermodesulfovibrio TaxID=2645936 RepID=UPI00085606C3|nr:MULTISPECIES: nucleotidyltransferase domain-containing protein [unclassified Thermodesulfovibrio]MDI1471313.1 nucleotidyltransferase domain-containing protein [Thermodesulfovibrio sp. 1176]MDI6714669.1 nucleotidyltransferase domain-containing protein [Thermodesulfovibrio sp.]ODA44116.1 hypothetical protein THER_1142 [Thermodesulfovibrio sp. N1]